MGVFRQGSGWWDWGWGWSWGWTRLIGKVRRIWGGDGSVGLRSGMYSRSFVEYATSPHQDGINKCFPILLEAL